MLVDRTWKDAAVLAALGQSPTLCSCAFVYWALTREAWATTQEGIVVQASPVQVTTPANVGAFPYSRVSVSESGAQLDPAKSLVLERTLSAPILPKGAGSSDLRVRASCLKACECQEPLPALRKINNPRWRR